MRPCGLYGVLTPACNGGSGAGAQVVDEGAGKNEGADELLSAFNVATFKSAEDDKAFWNRLIPADTRPDSAKAVRFGPQVTPPTPPGEGAQPACVHMAPRNQALPALRGAAVLGASAAAPALGHGSCRRSTGPIGRAA